MGSMKDDPVVPEPVLVEDQMVDVQDITPEEIARRRERARVLAILLLDFLLPKN